MSLTHPLFLLPIVIPTTGNLLTVDDGGGSTNVSIAAGTYYWGVDDGESGSLNEELATAMALAYGGSWTVDFSGGLLTITYAGGSTPTKITFLDTDVLSAHDLGDSLTVGDASITLAAKTWTGTYRVRWMWDPDEYVIDDEIIPHATVVTAQSIYDGSAVVIPYGEWFSRRVRMEAVDGARVYQWAVDDSGFASATGLETSEPWAALESMWRECREGPGAVGTPLTVRYVPDKATWVAQGPTYHDVRWQDQSQLMELEAVAPLLVEEPLLYRVTFTFRDLGTGS